MRSAAASLQAAKLGDLPHLISAFFKVRPHVISGDPASRLRLGGSPGTVENRRGVVPSPGHATSKCPAPRLHIARAVWRSSIAAHNCAAVDRRHSVYHPPSRRRALFGSRMARVLKLRSVVGYQICTQAGHDAAHSLATNFEAAEFIPRLATVNAQTLF